jgi:hypothetical protein
MNIKKYKVEHTPTYGEVEVEIDFDFVSRIKNETGEEDYPVMLCIQEMVNFWSGSEQRLDENEGDYVKTFLKQLCREVISITASRNLSTYGVIEQMKGEEGWCPLDGSCGIKLVSQSEPELYDQEDFEITEVI